MQPNKKQQTFALISRRHNPSVIQSLATIADFLHGAGQIAIYEEETARNLGIPGITGVPLDELGQTIAAAIVVGGDGTMLGIGRRLAPYNVPLIGINHGRLGFMADIPLDRMIPVLSDMLEGQFVTERRTLLDGAILREEQTIHRALAFNDIVISRGAGSGMIELSVEMDGHFMYSQRSDGLIISTPTGSTAYALSAGGPLLHPSLRGIEMSAIAPHALSNRPIVVPDSSEILVEIVDARFPTINFDSQSFASVHNGDCLLVRRAKCEVTFIHPKGWSYYDTLRDKLGWNESGQANSLGSDG